MDDSSPQSCGACGAWWRLPLVLAIVLAAVLLFKGLPREGGARRPGADNSSSTPGVASPDPAALPVSLTIEFAGGRQPFVAEAAWFRGMTVRDALQQVRRVELEEQGTGQAAFLTSINGVGNEGASGRNWLYSVNGKSADRSYAAYIVEPGDRILWTFVTSQ